MKKLLLALPALVVFSGSAFAADLAAHPYVKAPPAPPPVYDWTGFYIGLNGGGGSAHNCSNVVANQLFPENNVVANQLLPEFGETVETETGEIESAGSLGCHNATGGTVGGQIGYRWQFTNWVVGVEGQGNWADFRGGHDIHVVDEDLDDDVDVHISSRLDAFGLITGQVGYAWNNVLLYAKGGGAVTHNKYAVVDNSSGASVTGSDTRWGGAVGAGLEFGFWQGWSLGVEYDHLFMGGRDVGFATPEGPAFLHISQDVDMGLVRLNYRFGGPY